MHEISGKEVQPDAAVVGAVFAQDSETGAVFLIQEGQPVVVPVEERRTW